MKKAVWITFGVGLVLVNVIAEAADYFGGVYIPMQYRLATVLSFTIVAIVFSGAMALVSTAEEERPLSGHVKDTLGADKKKTD